MTSLVDKERAVDVVYLEFHKDLIRFNVVSHEVCTDILMSYELDKWKQRWTENWLNCQDQIFMISAQLEASSSHIQWNPVTSEVPQESILGQIQFNTFVTDLQDGAGS